MRQVVEMTFFGLTHTHVRHRLHQFVRDAGDRVSGSARPGLVGNFLARDFARIRLGQAERCRPCRSVACAAHALQPRRLLPGRRNLIAARRRDVERDAGEEASAVFRPSQNEISSESSDPFCASRNSTADHEMCFRLVPM